MKQTIGILGGTFDPVHTSHLELAEAARREYGLTKILFIPAAVPPHKRETEITSFEHRLRMLEIACEASAFFECSTIEGELPRPSYTVDTIKALQSGKGKGYTLYFIIGIDAFLDILTWKSYREIVQLVSLIVSKREGIDEKELANLAYSLGYKNTNGSVWVGSKGNKDICFLKKTPTDISSTSIRKNIRDNQITLGTIPEKVIEYIKTHKLYANQDLQEERETQTQLWEENVPAMKQGYHKELVRKAYELVPANVKVFPARENVFASMRQTSLADTKVVIIGQDPYFNEHPGKGPEAHGLCFSVRKGIPIPPSLRNILQEVNQSLYSGENVSTDSDLTRWAVQGVLMINASLTVIAKRPNSHAALGWNRLTDSLIETISLKKNHVVFMLWGAFAQKKMSLIDQRKHLILATSHPSPLSAHRGFLGSGVFVKCNDYLEKTGQEPIKW